MKLTWRKLKLPEFGVPEQRPDIPRQVFETRCREAYRVAGCDWLAVYGDREHFGNLHYLTEFDPRFEEALLLIGPDNRKYMLVGMESLDCMDQLKIDAEVVLYQTFGLMGQDRTKSPRLDDILRDIGLKKGDRVGICGWKYLEPRERLLGSDNLFVPAMLVDGMRQVVQGDGEIVDTTHVLMHPTAGQRVQNDVAQIAALEWGAARASVAVSNIVNGTKPGMTEFEAVANMRYAGEPLSAHVMFSAGRDKIVGLYSPSARKVMKGDGVTTAVAYWGGLNCRAGLIEENDDNFLTEFAMPYFRGIATWYEQATIGLTGGELYEIVSDVLAQGGLRPLLNPGHLTSTEEWLHTPVRPSSSEKIASGMAFQCDIIPTFISGSLPDGIGLNCEDSVVFADERLREELQKQYPEMWARVQARRQFIQEEIGLTISDELLPLSNNSAYFAPLWLSPDHVLTVA